MVEGGSLTSVRVEELLGSGRPVLRLALGRSRDEQAVRRLERRPRDQRGHLSTCQRQP